MASVIRSSEFEADIKVDCLIIGGGAAGLTAALAASETGANVLVAERENRLSGSTALSSGLIPAAGTNSQKSNQLPIVKMFSLQTLCQKTTIQLMLIT